MANRPIVYQTLELNLNNDRYPPFVAVTRTTGSIIPVIVGPFFGGKCWANRRATRSVRCSSQSSVSHFRTISVKLKQTMHSLTLVKLFFYYNVRNILFSVAGLYNSSPATRMALLTGDIILRPTAIPPGRPSGHFFVGEVAGPAQPEVRPDGFPETRNADPALTL